jgi:hypothetical protein
MLAQRDGRARTMASGVVCFMPWTGDGMGRDVKQRAQVCSIWDGGARAPLRCDALQIAGQATQAAAGQDGEPTTI